MTGFTQLLDAPQWLALAAALGWASGIRLYAAVFMVGLAGYMNWLDLPAGLEVLAHPAMLGVSASMLLMEFVADKIPLIDTMWDTAHTLIRIPAGAVLAAGALGADSGVVSAIAALMGGSLAAASHATKMTTRAAVNASPEPFSNIAVSLFEDGLVVAALWLAATSPVMFGIALAITLVLMVWLMVLLISFLKALLKRLGKWFGGASAA